jgi:16S rRNA G966 N2-methylase RsmD
MESQNIINSYEQYKVIEELFYNFENDLVINQLVLGKTQSGKTNLIKLFIEEIPNKTLRNDKIFLLTGYSSLDWLNQMKERLGHLIGIKNIFHQNHLRNSNIIKQFNSTENYIVFIDENHIACRKINNKKKRNKEIETCQSDSTPIREIVKEHQTITKLFEECHWNDIQYCIEKNIKIIQISATPDGTLYDLEEWGEHSKIVFYDPPFNYIGSYDLYKQGRLKQYQNLYETDITLQNEYIEDIITTIKTFQTPRYHIIRLKTGNKFNQVYNIFVDKIIHNEDITLRSQIKLCTFLFEKQNENNYDINDIFLKNKPEFHIILFIKEKLRCAKTITKKYLGLCYERISSMDRGRENRENYFRFW